MNIRLTLIQVNEQRVEGATHAQVVSLIRQGGESLSLTVSILITVALYITPSSVQLLSVPPGEASRLDPDDDQFYDYTDKAPINIKIPSYSYSTDNSFVQYHINLDDELVSMRRYSEFVALQAQIQRLFPDLQMPPLPGKWYFKMNEGQLQKRRAGLELWITGMTSYRMSHVITNSVF